MGRSVYKSSIVKIIAIISYFEFVGKRTILKLKKMWASNNQHEQSSKEQKEHKTDKEDIAPQSRRAQPRGGPNFNLGVHTSRDPP